MHRRLATAVVAGGMLIALTACAEDGQGAAAGRDQASPAESTLLSDGLWRRVVTSADAEKAGLGPADAADVLGADGQIVLELEIDGDRWKHYQIEDGTRSLGDLGTWSTDEDGNWVPVSESPGCRGCRTVIALSGTTGRVTTDILEDVPDPVARLMMEGTWERQ